MLLFLFHFDTDERNAFIPNHVLYIIQILLHINDLCACQTQIQSTIEIEYNICKTLILEMCEDYNYANDNTISDVKDTPDELKCSIEHDASNVTDWFDENGMKANTDKYQGIVFGVKPDHPMSFTVKGITV